MNQFFTELGRTVLAWWKKQKFSLACFPEIAREASEDRSPSSQVDVTGLVIHLLLNAEHPFQTGSGFGPPVVVFHADSRFYTQMLFWLEGSPASHQHAFCGAFHV